MKHRYSIIVWGNTDYTGVTYDVDSYEFVPGFLLTTVGRTTKAILAGNIKQLHITDWEKEE